MVGTKAASVMRCSASNARDGQWIEARFHQHAAALQQREQRDPNTEYESNLQDQQHPGVEGKAEFAVDRLEFASKGGRLNTTPLGRPVDPDVKTMMAAPVSIERCCGALWPVCGTTSSDAGAKNRAPVAARVASVTTAGA
jgi:hypothetical protein